MRAKFRRSTTPSSRVVGCLLVLAGSLSAQVDRELDAAVARQTLLPAAIRLEDVEERWEASVAPKSDTDAVWKELFGYNPPGTAISLAYVHAWLFEKEGDADDARKAARYLARMADYRDRVPESQRFRRVEYEDGLPAVPSFFHLADYAEAWSRIRASAAVDDATRKKIVDAIAGSAEFIFVFPEWGAHNRAMLRAECLAWSARAIPDHPNAARWRRMARILADDSRGQWEIEDAQIYHPIWLLALLRYAEATNDASIVRSRQVRYYLDYFTALLAPDGTMPAFGDSWHRGGLSRYYACLEWGAQALRDPHLRWAASEVWRAMGPTDPKAPSLGHAVLYARLDGHIATDLEPEKPVRTSGPVLDDVIGKKTVFRAGSGPQGTYLLHNFRDEGDWGRLHRDYLRSMLAVKEEKMHHGASDENSIVLFMDQGSVLLHGPGYRDVAPSGPHGAYRADIFHNRVVARRGVPRKGQDPFEFLKDDGAYRPVRTERIDWVTFEDGPEYSRTRLTDEHRGYVWDRTIIKPRAERDAEPPTFVVIDTIRIAKPGEWTFARLWATQKIIHRNESTIVGRYRSMRGRPLGGQQCLLVADPTPGAILGVAPLRRHSQDEHVIHSVRSGEFRAGDVISFATVLKSIHESESANPGRPVSEIRAHQGTTATAVRVGKSRFVVKHDPEQGLQAADVRPRLDPEAARIAAFGFTTDADFLWVRRGLEHDRWGATNLTHLARGPTELFKARPFNVFQPSGRSDRVGLTRWRQWGGILPRIR